MVRGGRSPWRNWHLAPGKGRASRREGRPLIGHNDRVATPGAGHVPRAGARRGVRRHRGLQPALLLIGLGALLAVVAWGFLVWAAIDFGQTARGGQTEAWAFLALASIGAVACLFLGLMLVALLLRRLGITSTHQPHKH